MFEVPKRPAAIDTGDDSKVIGRRRRACGPLQRPGVPWIGAGDRPFEIRPDEVVDEDERSGCLEKRSTGRDHVQDHPSAIGLVGIYASWHPQDAGNMHEVKGQMKTDKKEPEMPLAGRFALQNAGLFW